MVAGVESVAVAQHGRRGAGERTARDARHGDCPTGGIATWCRCPSLPAPARVGTLDACSPSARWPRPTRGRRRAPSSPTSRSSSRRRLRRDHGRVGRRQVDAAEPARRPRPARCRHDRGRRRRPRDARRRRADAAAPPADGLRVPGVPRAAVPDGRRRTSRCRSRCSGSADRAAGERVRRCSPRSACATAARACRASCPAASCSASRSRARSSIARALVLADEPTGNLDPDSAASVLALLRDAVKAAGRRGHPGHAFAAPPRRPPTACCC